VDSTLNIVSTTVLAAKVRLQQQHQLYSLSQRPAHTGPQTTGKSKFFDFLPDTIQKSYCWRT